MTAVGLVLILSGLSIAVSVALGALGLRLQRQVTKIEEGRRTDEIEARKRAEMTVQFLRRPVTGKPQPCLILRNNGPANATNIYFDADDLQQQAHLRVIGREAVPIQVLASGEQFTFVLALYVRHADRHRVHLALD